MIAGVALSHDHDQVELRLCDGDCTDHTANGNPGRTDSCGDQLIAPQSDHCFAGVLIDTGIHNADGIA